MCTYIYTYRENLKGTKVRDRGMSPRHMHIMIIQNSFTYISVHMLKIAVYSAYVHTVHTVQVAIYIYIKIYCDQLIE